MITPQYTLDLHHELIIDNFAGGGGASTGIEMATGRHVDIAINHDPKAIAMHQANHPQTLHLCESVWDVNPREVVQGRKVALVWLSPDCKHFSKAKGGKPVEKKIRGLAWVAVRWAATIKPRVIILENVEEFVTWGPLITDENGNARPCPKNKGREFNAFVNALKAHGYEVQYTELRASDYGTPTIRNRLFLVARCDGEPIVWPEVTHGNPNTEAVKSKRLKPWRTAAECIDWSIPCPSIFERKKPLADATNRRVAKGIMRYVVNAADPFIVNTRNGERAGQKPRVRSIDEPFWTVTAQGSQHALVTPFISEHANASNQRNMPVDEPMRTLCAQVKGGHFSVVAPMISTYYGEKSTNEVRGIPLDQPLQTQTTENRHALVNAFLTKFRTGAVGSDLDEPMHTITAGSGNGRPAGAGHAMGVVTAHLMVNNTGHSGAEVVKPMPTITTGLHHAQVQAFLVKYYGTDGDLSITEPLHTITTKDRFGLVQIKGQLFQIYDIGLRMLWPVELFKAQGFPDNYIFDRGMVVDRHGIVHWIQLTKSEQVRMVGNSVCPPVAAALVRANLPELCILNHQPTTNKRLAGVSA